MSIDAYLNQLKSEDAKKASEEAEKARCLNNALDFVKHELSSGAVRVVFGDACPEAPLMDADFYFAIETNSANAILYAYVIARGDSGSAEAIEIDRISIDVNIIARISRTYGQSEFVYQLTDAEVFGRAIAKILAAVIHGAMNTDFSDQLKKIAADRIIRYNVWFPSLELHHNETFDTLEDAIQFAMSRGFKFSVHDSKNNILASYNNSFGLMLIGVELAMQNNQQKFYIFTKVKNGGYRSSETFDTLEDAVAFGRRYGSDFEIEDLYGRRIASWSRIGNTLNMRNVAE